MQSQEEPGSTIGCHPKTNKTKKWKKVSIQASSPGSLLYFTTNPHSDQHPDHCCVPRPKFLGRDKFMSFRT